MDELGWEFNQEGRRRQDLIRFGVWTTKSWLSHSATNDINKNLYPIPRAELDKNGKLKQNPWDISGLVMNRLSETCLALFVMCGSGQSFSFNIYLK